MERQAGLGRSLEDVLDSLTPVEPDPTAPARVLFEPDDLERQLEQLMCDLAALRNRVQALVQLVPEDALPQAAPATELPTARPPDRKKKHDKHDKHDKHGKRGTKAKRRKHKDGKRKGGTAHDR